MRWDRNEDKMFISIHITINVKRVLTSCSDAGIIDRRGVIEMKTQGFMYIHINNNEKRPPVVMQVLLIDEVIEMKTQGSCTYT